MFFSRSLLVRLVGITTMSLSSALPSMASPLEDHFPFASLEASGTDLERIDVASRFPVINSAWRSGYLDTRQVIFSVDRQRDLGQWLANTPSESGHYIVINIPDYQLYLIEQRGWSYDVVMESKVVVGSSAYRTPLDPMKIVSLKYNPTWTPTRNIIARNLYTSDGSWNSAWVEGSNLVPHSRSTGATLTREEAMSTPIDDLVLIQPPGDNNALGRLKFETDSGQHIYLHDTNEKSYFSRENRARSSGCIRVEQPYLLASLISGQSVSNIEANVSRGDTWWQDIPDVPVYILYDVTRYERNDLSSLEDPYGIFGSFDTKSGNYSATY